MQRAEVTDEVWSALLALRAGRPAGRDADWPAEARAAWALYAPLADRRRAARPISSPRSASRSTAASPRCPATRPTISGPDGLRHLHRCRALADAVVVGVRTALADDPRLTVRLVAGPSPARVVIDPRGRLPDEAQVLRRRRRAAAGGPGLRPHAAGGGRGGARCRPPTAGSHPARSATALAERGLTRVLVEGGGVTIAGFLDAGLLQRLHVAIAPLIIGAGPSGLRTAPVARLADALRPETHVYGLDSDVVFDCALAPAGSASTSTWPTVQRPSRSPPAAPDPRPPPPRSPPPPPPAAIPSTSAACSAACAGPSRHGLGAEPHRVAPRRERRASAAAASGPSAGPRPLSRRWCAVERGAAPPRPPAAAGPRPCRPS